LRTRARRWPTSGTKPWSGQKTSPSPRITSGKAWPSTKKKADALKFCQSTDCASLYNLNAYASLERNLTDVLTHLETVVVPHIQTLAATVRKDRLKYETKRGGRTQVRRRR